MVRGTGLEPARLNHTPLKRARLPIPPPSRNKYIIQIKHENVNNYFTKSEEIFNLRIWRVRFAEK